MACIKTFKLNNGHEFPAVGLGTWQGKANAEDEKALEDSIIHALKSGYRLIDTAQMYGVEQIVGRAVRNSGIPRSEITVVSKFWGEWHHNPAEALRISLRDLDIEYLDVFLMHWPWATTPAPEKKPLKKWDSPTFVETWKMMEELVGEKCRAIGVSNFTPKTLEELAASSKVVPAINQVELHPLNPHHKLVEYCQEKGIVVMGWATLRGGGSNKLFDDIAQAHGVSTGVVSLSWAVQRGVNVIPKSANPKRIEENIKLVTLSDDEMKAMNEAWSTIGKHRLSNNIANQHIKVDGKNTQMGWTYAELGWEDEKGNWIC